MTRAKFIEVVFFALCAAFICAASALAADGPPGAERAAELLGRGQAEEAYRIYSALLREFPEDGAVNLGLARSAMAANRPHQAIMAYERLIAKYPGELALYREIAAAYMAVGDPETAKRYLARDASLNPDDVSDWAVRMGEAYNRFQFHGKLRAGFLFDGNANQGLDSNRITLGGFAVTMRDAEKIDTFGGYLAGDFDAAYRASRTSPWWVVGDAHFYLRRDGAGGLSDAEMDYSQWYRISGGIRRLTPNSLFDIRLKGEIFDYDFYRTVYAYGPEITYTRAVSRTLHLITRAGVERRDYVRNGDHSGTYGYAGEYARFLFGAAEHEFVIGGRYLFADAERDFASYGAWEASASMRFKLGGGWELSPSVSYAEERYDAPATVLETDDRRDRRFRAGLNALYRI
ncbi:MAG: tetratricopeptide repeat protein, partial [Synergistaceae bacterium]|nr:tetratricopeptide repeat protein [Synergistaceae bacterium]